MDELALVKKRLSEIPLSELEAVGNGCRPKVPFGTLHKIKYGTTKNPSFKTVKALADYFSLAGVSAAR